MTDYGARPDRSALGAAFVCYVMWGLMPLLFMGQAAVGFDALEILAHRAVWSVLFAGALVLLSRRWGELKAVFGHPATVGWLAVSTVMIAINWGLYVWATTHHATIEASLGYYINPLLNMVAGLWLFRERIDRAGWIAIAMAAVGVALQTAALGRPPWIALIIAVSFATYAVVRKRVDVGAQTGLLVECLLLAPLGLIWLAWMQSQGTAVGLHDPVHLGWAVLNGPATVLPLVLFAWAARRLPLSTLGFIQFLAPTLQFAVGVATGEPLTALRLASFGFIWGGAAVFAAAAWLKSRAERRALAASADPI